MKTMWPCLQRPWSPLGIWRACGVSPRKSAKCMQSSCPFQEPHTHEILGPWDRVLTHGNEFQNLSPSYGSSVVHGILGAESALRFALSLCEMGRAWPECGSRGPVRSPEKAGPKVLPHVFTPSTSPPYFSVYSPFCPLIHSVSDLSVRPPISAHLFAHPSVCTSFFHLLEHPSVHLFTR